jgi:magnesium transporter
MIKYYYRSVKEKKVKEIENFRVGTWIYVESPTKVEINQLAEQFKFDPGLLSDALDPHEVPRLERDDEKTYIFTRSPDENEKEVITTIPLLVTVNENFILTLSSKKVKALDKLFSSETEFYTTQKTKFLIQIFSSLEDDYEHLLNNINRKVGAARVQLEKIENKDIIQLVYYEEIISDFLSALIPTNSVLQKLLSGKYMTLFEEDRDLIEDLFLSTGQLVETSKSLLTRIVNIRNSYSTIMSHDLNRIIKLLTALTIIFTVPTAIASLYGMNVKLPLQDSPSAFVLILAVNLTILLILVYIFIRNKWL